MFFSESISKMKRERERERWEAKVLIGEDLPIGNKEQNIFEEAAQLTKPQHRHA